MVPQMGVQACHSDPTSLMEIVDFFKFWVYDVAAASITSDGSSYLSVYILCLILISDSCVVGGLWSELHICSTGKWHSASLW